MGRKPDNVRRRVVFANFWGFTCQQAFANQSRLGVRVECFSMAQPHFYSVAAGLSLLHSSTSPRRHPIDLSLN